MHKNKIVKSIILSSVSVCLSLFQSSISLIVDVILVMR